MDFVASLTSPGLDRILASATAQMRGNRNHTAGSVDPMMSFATLPPQQQHALVPTDAESMWDPLADLGVDGTALGDLLSGDVSLYKPLLKHTHQHHQGVGVSAAAVAAALVMPAAVDHEQGPYQHQHQHLSVATVGAGSGVDLQVPELAYSAASSDAGSMHSCASSSYGDVGDSDDFEVPRDDFALPGTGTGAGEEMYHDHHNHYGRHDTGGGSGSNGYGSELDGSDDNTGDSDDSDDADEEHQMVSDAQYAADPATNGIDGRRMSARQLARHTMQQQQHRSSSPSSSSSSSSSVASSMSSQRQHRIAPAKTARSSSKLARARAKASPVPEYEGPLPDSFWDLSEEQVAALSFRDFTKMTSKSKLSKAQIAEAKRTRRRIKNRHSARECSTRRRERTQHTSEDNQTLQQEVTQLMAEKDAISTQHMLLQERAIELEKSRASAVQSNLYLEAEVTRLSALLNHTAASA